MARNIAPIHHPNADLLDRTAMGLSLACMTHCLAVPLSLALMPALLPVAWDDRMVHMAALAIAIPLAITSLRRNYNLITRSLAGVGLTLMAAGVILHKVTSLEVLLTFIGAVFVGSAHLRSYLRHH